MTDFDEMREHFDLLALVEQDLGPGKRSGRWYAWRCPFHDGKRSDDFQVTPDTGRYFCFGCGCSGDALSWLHEYRRLNWKDIFSLGDSSEPAPARPRPALPDPESEGPPASEWQAEGQELVKDCEAFLWEPAGAKVLAWLHGRGLRDETIKRYRLGYNPDELYASPELWGLTGKKIWMPRGVVIPAIVAGALWYIKIRQPAGDPKYIQPRGGRPALFGAANLRGAEIVLLTEGEFDCILADQELGDVVGVATLGSAQKKLDLRSWGAYLLPARAILAAYDLDPAGNRGQAALVALSARIHSVRVPRLGPKDKDITDYYRAGGDLWEWLGWQLDQVGTLKALGVPYDDGTQPAEIPAETVLQSGI